MDELTTLDDFIADYGYEINSADDFRRVVAIFEACKAQSAGLRKLFSPAELEQLAEIQ
jgi:hypothetical protein